MSKSILRIAESYARPHIEQANQCLKLADYYTLENDKVSAAFWQRMWKAKQKDAEEIKATVMRAYR